MTYTFKLARRLAVSRKFIMLPAWLVFVACSGGDATAPEGSPAETPTADAVWRPRDLTPVTVQLNPSSVTLETNQLIQFRAHGRNSAGDSVGAAVTWSTSGGTILPDGRFSAAAIGTYSVTGVNRVRGEVLTATSTVLVVRRQLKLKSLDVTPGSAELSPGMGQTFTAIGRLANGDSVPVGVNWLATGGGIDAGGSYLAGDTAGTYRVVATNTAGTLADTATVTISAPPSLPPPEPTPEPAPAPAPAPTPVLVQVTLTPSSVTLAPSTTKQFAAYGLNSVGDSVSVSVVFTATGGTVTSGGLYTAGSTAGTFRLIATSGALADTSAITITSPLGSGTPVGLPFGPFGAWDGSTLRPYTEDFTGSLNSVSADYLVDRINAARTLHKKLLLAMTGGSHDNYKTNGVFDMAKWQAKMDTYKTSAIKTAVAAGVSDGTIIGNIVMDEPSNTSPDNSWGPVGTMNKARVDSMAAYARAIFPTLPMGVTMDYSIWPDQSYKELDFIISQYRWAKGDVTAYRDGALALGARDGHRIAFSMNVIDGGYKISGCPIPQTGGPGSYSTNCRMTAQQVHDYGFILGPAGCSLVMWRYDTDFMAASDNQQAFKDVANRLTTAPAMTCRRP
ncbi:MAG TPA: hypothetical protein VGJ36_08655 [Gemmatimonadales bacterium]